MKGEGDILIKKRIKGIIKFLLNILKKVTILVIGGIIVGYILSIVLKTDLRTTIMVIGLIIMGIGALSVMGGTKITSDPNYGWVKSNSGIKDIGKTDLELRLDSYQFCIFMGVAGIIILLIGSFMI